MGGRRSARSGPGRCISLTSKPGDLVLDPFVGSGTSAVAAMELGRRFIGFDTSQTYLAAAQRRTKQLSARTRSHKAKLVEVPIERTIEPSANARSRKKARTLDDSDALPIDAGSSERSVACPTRREPGLRGGSI